VELTSVKGTPSLRQRDGGEVGHYRQRFGATDQTQSLAASELHPAVRVIEAKPGLFSPFLPVLWAVLEGLAVSLYSHAQPGPNIHALALAPTAATDFSQRKVRDVVSLSPS
jgi:hypothetical protein